MTDRAVRSSGQPSQRELLEQHGLEPKRSFGQNFLLDTGILTKLSNLIGDDAKAVLEIGAGLGALTGPLLERGLSVIAVERDRDLIPILRRRFQDPIERGQLKLLEADAKTLDQPALLATLPVPRVLAGNLPYQLTGPLLRQACAAARSMERAVFLVQLEVAERLIAGPSSKEYGALSVFVQRAFAVRKAMVVRSGAFYPPPKVDSAVVVLTPHLQPMIEESKAFAELVRRAFQQRRKTLRNAWHGVAGVSATELQVKADRAGIELGARGETLSVEDFARMARELAA